MSKALFVIKKVLTLSPLACLIILIFPGIYPEFGGYARNLLLLILFIRPVSDILPRITILRKIVNIRRELGILMATCAIAHGVGFFIDNGLGITFFFGGSMRDFTSSIARGGLASILLLPLLVTSNTYSMSLLGIYRKKLQMLVYPTLFFVAIHIIILSDDKVGTILRVIGYGAIYTFARWWKKSHPDAVTSSVKYSCIPCGYIYDEAIGDPDGGIAPGTRFAEIPETRRCPVCGVTKKDFLLIVSSDVEDNINGTIVGKKIINPLGDVIQLDIALTKEYEIIPGQSLLFSFIDAQGIFSRNYSISQKQGNTLSFLIKVLPTGRAGQIIQTVQIGDDIKATGPYGSLVLHDVAPSVFVATGTGLSPLYHMMLTIPDQPKILLFGVKDSKSLFYGDELARIPNLTTYVYLSDETMIPPTMGPIHYIAGMISVKTLELPVTTPRYLCGNPAMVASVQKELATKGYTRVYTEQFT